MAINKVVNKSTKSHGAMRNVLEYVLRDKKVKEGYVEITGPFPYEEITWDNTYNAFLDEKRLWGKDTGRMYMHNIISFHKDEKITPEQVLEIGRTFVAKFFPDNQCVISIHQDKDHLHLHIVTNTVSFIDGRKYHQTKHGLEAQKVFTNELCRERGLTITEKGNHFDGTAFEQGETTVWSKDKYNLLLNETKKSFVADCAIAVMTVVPETKSREDFIAQMAERGWHTSWEDNKKHITFENESGQKVRDSNLSKTFNLKISKEDLNHEFERKNEQSYYNDYYAEINAEHTITPKAIRSVENCDAGTRQTASRGKTRGCDDDTDTFLEELRADRSAQAAAERLSAEKRDYSVAKRAHRDAEQKRSHIEAERATQERELLTTLERAKRKKRSRRYEYYR